MHTNRLLIVSIVIIFCCDLFATLFQIHADKNRIYFTTNININLNLLVVTLSPECQFPGADLEINPTLESLCLSMTEHALGGECPQQPGHK